MGGLLVHIAARTGELFDCQVPKTTSSAGVSHKYGPFGTSCINCRSVKSLRAKNRRHESNASVKHHHSLTGDAQKMKPPGLLREKHFHCAEMTGKTEACFNFSTPRDQRRDLQYKPIKPTREPPQPAHGRAEDQRNDSFGPIVSSWLKWTDCEDESCARHVGTGRAISARGKLTSTKMAHGSKKTSPRTRGIWI